MRYEKEVYSNRLVELDGHEYIGCHFEDCELVYSGGPPPLLYGCSFLRTGFTFANAAENTLRFMADIFRTAGPEGRQLIEETFDSIRQGWTSDEQGH